MRSVHQGGVFQIWIAVSPQAFLQSGSMASTADLPGSAGGGAGVETGADLGGVNGWEVGLQVVVQRARTSDRSDS
jgi:hypothetical protein